MTAKALQVAVLDDYQNAARHCGPWPELAGSADVYPAIRASSATHLSSSTRSTGRLAR